MFDFTPGRRWRLALAGVVFLALRLPAAAARPPGARPRMDERFDIKDYTTEARGGRGLRRGRHDREATAKSSADGEVEVTASACATASAAPRPPDAVCSAGDILLLEGEPEALERDASREQAGARRRRRDARTEDADDEIGVIEAVVTPDSALIGQLGRADHAVRPLRRQPARRQPRADKRFAERLRAVTLAGRRRDRAARAISTAMPETLGELRLPAAGRARSAHRQRSESYLPIAVLAAAMALVAFHLVPVTVAFFGAAVLLLLTRSLACARPTTSSTGRSWSCSAR